MKQDETNTFLSVNEIARRWNCNRCVVDKLVSDGSLKAFRAGGKVWRVKLADLEEYESKRSNIAAKKSVKKRQ